MSCPAAGRVTDPGDLVAQHLGSGAEPGRDPRALLPTGAVVTYAHREAVRFIGKCWLVGAVLGAIVSVVKERHG